MPTTEIMGLRTKIINFIANKNSEVALNELYNSFPEETKTTVRGRLYEAIGHEITRVGKGLYISSKAFIELGDSREIVKDLHQAGTKFDFIFLDIPCEAGGQKGGNRNLFACDKISAYEFSEFMNHCKELLRTDKSPLLYMFTSGRSSKPAHDRYFKEIINCGLIECVRKGTYQKLWKNGNPMNTLLRILNRPSN